MVTAAGSGYSRWRDLAVTRWREDVTRDCWGSYLFLRDTQTGVVWSAGHQPQRRRGGQLRGHLRRGSRRVPPARRLDRDRPDDRRLDRARRRDPARVADQPRLARPRDRADVLRGDRARPTAADVAHPAFQNLFVQTEFVPEIGALLATRRPRSRDEQPVWAAHVAAIEEERSAAIQYETDRARFLGRGRTVRSPVSVIDGRPLSNTVGAVLDPIFSLRCRVRLAPGASAHVIFSTVVAESREEVLDLADKYREPATFERAATLAWTQAQVQLHHLGIERDEAHLFQRLANRILYSDPTLRPSPSLLARNERGAPGLWAHGISGDLPDRPRPDRPGRGPRHRPAAPPGARVLAPEAPRRRPRHPQRGGRLLRPGPPRCRSRPSVRTSQSILRARRPPGRGGVFILRGDRLSPEDRTLLQAAARAVLLSRPGHAWPTRSCALERPRRAPRPPPPPEPRRSPRASRRPPRPELEFFNGLGGFADGRPRVRRRSSGRASRRRRRGST